MASFTRIITAFLFVYGFELVLRFSGIFTVMEGEGKEFGASGKAGNRNPE